MHLRLFIRTCPGLLSSFDRTSSSLSERTKEKRNQKSLIGLTSDLGKLEKGILKGAAHTVFCCFCKGEIEGVRPKKTNTASVGVTHCKAAQHLQEGFARMSGHKGTLYGSSRNCKNSVKACSAKALLLVVSPKEQWCI